MTSDADAEADADPDPVVRAGGEHAARDAVTLMLGLAATLEHQVAARSQLHPDLYSSLIERLRRAGTELATAHDLEDLLDPNATPADGTAWAQQLTALLRESPRERDDAPRRPGDPTMATTPREPTTASPEDPGRVTELLDRSGDESFPASDPPSV